MSAPKGKGGGKGGAPASAKSRRGASGSGSQGSKKAEDEREESLPAVILADSFETRFNPFTLEGPRCLLPLANTPLIEYTLSFLAMSGVSQIYIYSGAHTERISAYLSTSKWDPHTSPASPFSLLETIKSSARSIGDAMRDLDSRDIITGDFLLVHGDLVSNLPIDDALKRHRERRLKDKNAIMTMILRSGGLGGHRTKSKGVTPVFVLDPANANRCLHYEEMHPLQANRRVNIDPDLLSEHTEMEIRTDLIDCGIDICTPDVLALWSESFDYEVPRRHFLHGVLKDYELNGKTLFAEVTESHYAARVCNLQSYEAVSKDVLGRWTYPLVPDSNLMAGQSYKFERGGLCKENGVVLARTCRVGKRTVLGAQTSIGEGSTISNSIVGRRCQIGKNVTIQNAFLWDDVVVGDGASIERAIVANEAVVGKNCTINPGALLSFGVRVADNKAVAEGQRITRSQRSTEEDSEASRPIASEPSVVGDAGEGYLFEESSSDDEDETTTYHRHLIYSTTHLNLSTDSISTLNSHPSSPSLSATQPRSRLSSFASLNSDTEDQDRNDGFHKDAVTGVLDTLKENGDFDSSKLEFMGLRLANDATDHQIRRAIATAFGERVSQLVEEGLETTAAAKQVFEVRNAAKFVKEVGTGGDHEGQVLFIGALQRDLAGRGEKGGSCLAALLQRLYQDEVLEEEGILGWWEQCEGVEGEKEEMKRIREKSRVLVEWLKEAEEGSSEEESEEESD